MNTEGMGEGLGAMTVSKTVKIKAIFMFTASNTNIPILVLLMTFGIPGIDYSSNYK